MINNCFKDQCRTNDRKINIMYTYLDLWMSSGMYPGTILGDRRVFFGGGGGKNNVGSYLRSWAYSKMMAAKMVFVRLLRVGGKHKLWDSCPQPPMAMCLVLLRYF